MSDKPPELFHVIVALTFEDGDSTLQCVGHGDEELANRIYSALTERILTNPPDGPLRSIEISIVGDENWRAMRAAAENDGTRTLH